MHEGSAYLIHCIATILFDRFEFGALSADGHQ